MAARGKKPLSLEKKAYIIACAAANETKTDAARMAGVSRASVNKSLAEAETNPELREAAEQAQKTLAQKFEDAVNTAIGAIIVDAPNAKVRDSAQVCALVDKMLLLRGQPTVITETLTSEQRKARILELQEKAKGLRLVKDIA